MLFGSGQSHICFFLCQSRPCGLIYTSVVSHQSSGRDPLDQNFRKFRYKIEWNRTFLETHFENFGQPPEVVLFSGNLEIPGISCSIGHYHSVSSSPRPKRWRRQVFSPAIRMFLRFTRYRIILMTHLNIIDATTRFVQFLEEKFLDLVKCNVT